MGQFVTREDVHVWQLNRIQEFEEEKNQWARAKMESGVVDFVRDTIWAMRGQGPDLMSRVNLDALAAAMINVIMAGQR